MPELPEHPTHIRAEVHFRNLLDEEGCEPPDEVLHWHDPDEVVFMWHEPKVAIVIELAPDGSMAVREGLPADAPPV